MISFTCILADKTQGQFRLGGGRLGRRPLAGFENLKHQGERPAAPGGGVAAAVIEQHFKRFLVGEDPFNIEMIYDRMNRSTLPYGLGGVTSMAMAGVDLALYDLVAKALGIPVYKFLGGRTKDSIPCYATIHPDYASHWKDHGFFGVKIAALWGAESGREGLAKVERLEQLLQVFERENSDESFQKTAQ